MFIQASSVARLAMPFNLKRLTNMQTNIYQGYDYLTKVVNRDFRIKVFGLANGQRVNKLVGVSGLIRLIGVDLANTLTERAFRQSYSRDVVHCKLRRGLRISFYNK